MAGRERLPAALTTTRRLTLLTYNIHSGVGRDKRYDLGRIRRVLDEERPDIAALQELECGSRLTSYDDQAKLLAGDRALSSSFCATRPAGQGSFGLGVLTAFPVLREQHYDLSVRGAREPRFCLRVDLEIAPGAVLHVFTCHLGLGPRERTFQRKQMVSDAILLGKDLQHPVVLMGDFNDRPIPVVHRDLRKHFTDTFTALGKRGGATFKAGPIALRLDHIYVSERIRVLESRVRNDELTRIASDHRPVIATVEVTWP